MRKVTKYFAVFVTPGAFFADNWHEEITEAATKDPASIAWPDNAYAFTIDERIDVEDLDGTTYTGKVRQLGPTYYHPDSKVESYAQVLENPAATNILRTNMRSNNWAHIVWTRWGNWPQPYDPATITVLPRKGT